MVDSLHWDGIDDLNSAYNSSQIGEMGAIFLSQDDGKAMFKVTTSKLHHPSSQ